MNYRLLRINSQEDHSMGVLYSVSLNDLEPGPVTKVRYLCYTLEDEFRKVKVFGETRIPVGTYELELRTEGSLTKRYEARFPDIHEGMIWLRAVPNFKYIYLHCGNDDEDTNGCILVGNYLTVDRILNSRITYRDIYPGIRDSIKIGQSFLEVIDYDSPPVEG